MAIASLDAATEFVYTRIVDNYTTTSYVFNDEVDEDLDTGEDPWVRFSVLEVGRNQETLGAVGDRRYRSTCELIAQVFTLAGTGTSTAKTLAEEIRTLFEGVAFNELDFIGGVQLVILPNNDKKWKQTNVRGTFAYEQTK